MPVLILNKPIYVEFTVLDLSKWKMYDLHHNFIKKNFDAGLVFTDKDSLMKMFIKNFLSRKKKIHSFLMKLTKKLLVK